MKGRFPKHQPGYLTWIAGLLCLGVAFPIVHTLRQEAPSNPLADSPYLRIDPSKMVLDEGDSRIPCGECHTLEYDVWRTTLHATDFKELHTSKRAQEIRKSMGFRLVKRESLCLRCHYTAKLIAGRAKAIAGVSCESCHGAARDWLDIHNNYGGADHDTETAAHQQQRIAQSTANGMLRPSDDLYAVAANCFECHTVPNEELVNVGGHTSGSAFDLIEWSDAIRHNLLPAQWGGGETNRAQTAERKRLMYVIGAALNYEYNLRAAAEATEKGNYSQGMAKRVKKAYKALDRVHDVVPLQAVKDILNRGREPQIMPNNKAALLAAADDISAMTQRFSRENDGAGLAALDPLIAGIIVEPPDDGDGDEGGDAKEDTTNVVGPPGGDNGKGTGGDSTVVIDEGIPVEGRKRRQPAWFSEASYKTLGPGGCDCHDRGDIYDWWRSDTHYQSVERFYSNPKAIQIATTYELSPTQAVSGNQICMNCHGTIEDGEVYEGVSCESCHGPGSGYAKKHKKDPPPRAYAQGASLGMINQENPTNRANNCVRCHHITDVRLISSGHPTGEGFVLSSRNREIKHWEGDDPSDSALDQAYRQATASRPIPQNVQIATPPTILAVTPGDPGGPAPDGPGPPLFPGFPPRPNDPDGPSVSTLLGLPTRPVISDSTSTEELLLIIKQRLELLYKALGRGQ